MLEDDLSSMGYSVHGCSLPSSIDDLPKQGTGGCEARGKPSDDESRPRGRVLAKRLHHWAG